MVFLYKMRELELIFDPSKKLGEKIEIKDVQKLKKSLKKIQINTSMFTTILDSIEMKGEIWKLKRKEISDSEDILLEFKKF